MPEKADVIIIGGGVMGCAIAYNLAREGLKPVVIEKSDIGGEASGANGGGVRQSARNLKEMPLAIESIQIYGQLHEELGMDLEYVREGNLRLCTSEEELDTMRKSVENQKAANLELEMLDRKQVLNINPHIGEKVLGASFCPSDGHVNPFLVTYAFYQKAKSLGARFFTHEEVKDVRLQKSKVTGVISDNLPKWIDQINCRPCPGSIGIPDLIFVVVNDWVTAIIAQNRLADALCFRFLGEFCGMDADHDKRGREFRLKLGDIRNDMHAVDTAKRPEIEQDDFPPQVLA